MKNDIEIRTYQPGDPSMVSHLQMMIYQKQYGFKGIFEYYLAKGIAEFLNDPAGSQLWVAKKDGVIVGSIAIVKSGEHSAQLRWFAVDHSMQGAGIGSQLLYKAMEFCEACGYTHVVLWTIDILHAARHLYKNCGFIPVETRENTEWTNHTLLEEKWEKGSPSD